MIYRRDGKHRIARKLMENVPANHFLPYPYQLDLLDTAYERNTIICLSNELTKNFIILSLIREMGYDCEGKHVIYFTPDKHITATSRCLIRHTGLSVGCFVCEKPYTEWRFPQWTVELMEYHIVILSPWLIRSLCSGASGKELRHFISNNFYLLALNECHHVLDPSHPYFQLLGPRYLQFFNAGGSNVAGQEVSNDDLHNLRVICFTSALLPRDLTDSHLAETRLIELERRTNCRLETASQLLTLLSLGARPQEYVRIVPNTYSEQVGVHKFVARVLAEVRELLLDVRIDAIDLATMDSAPDSRGRMIDIMDYCRRAIVQCEEILSELGVWCAAQIARVFVKHLIGLNVRRTRLLQQKSTPSLAEHREDPLALLLQVTITQLCLIVRLCQTEFDTCLTLETFRTMISPKVLALVEQLKEYKPNMNFRIEIAELPPSSVQPRVKRKANRGRNNRKRSSTVSDSLSLSSSSFLPDELSASSDSSVDTMSSLSDEEDNNQNHSRSRKSSASRDSGAKTCFRRRKSKSNAKCSRLNAVKARDLNFVPSSTLLSDAARSELDHSQLVYRAVLNPDEQSQKTQPPRLYGLVLVRCQFTAYALSRLIDELCVWDVDLFFVKPGHLFSSTSSSSGDATRSERTSDYAVHQSTLKTGDDTSAVPSSTQATLPATQEETIAKFRHGAINLLVATQPAISAAAGGAELPRCNLIVTLQPPSTLAEYLSSKARSRLVDQGTRVIYLVDKVDRISPSGDGSFPMDVDNETNQNASSEKDIDQVLGRFQKLEKLLVQRCRGYTLLSDEHDVDPVIADRVLPQLMPRGPHGPKLSLSKSINIINQYCARLPSDYITNLTPRWRLKLIPQSESWSPPLQGPGASCGSSAEIDFARKYGLFQCLMRLPINSSIKDEIQGEPMACKKLAKLSTALNAVRLLYAAGELDSRWEPCGKGASVSVGTTPSRSLVKPDPSCSSLTSLDVSEWEPDICDFTTTCNPTSHEDLNSFDGLTTRRRQYYYRKVADQMQNCLPQAGESPPNYLYFIEMRLTNAVPDEQNIRGRPCFRPEDEPTGFGLLTSKPLNHIPAFPIFSRSGEETVRLIEFWSPLASSVPHTVDSTLPIRPPSLTEDQLNRLIKFHHILFQAVLRLDREAVIEFNIHKSYTQVLVVPVRRDTLCLEWDFIALVLTSYTADGFCRLPPRRDPSQVPENHTILSAKHRSVCRLTGRTRSCLRSAHSGNTTSLLNQPGVFQFREEDFLNAVVMPTYRNLDQPQHYYVADIRYDLSPISPFPSSAYPDFATYYTTKYEATLTTLDQPLLDVDFTVLRLNLLVPRYINARGYCLPRTSDSRKRDKRENLTHKQILIPELCFRHPFPASVWRKAVCIPSILYRLHSLLLAEELRRRIAYETGLGRVRLPIQNKMKRQDAEESASVFEPLRLVFPLQIPERTTMDENMSIAPEANLNSCSAHSDSDKRTLTSNDSRISTKSKSIEDEDEMHNTNLPSSDTQTQPDTSAEPVFVKLRAVPAPNAAIPGVLSSLEGGATLESLLEETKVIELDDLAPSNELNESDSDDFVMVGNRMNMDLEFHPTDSDVESVDSFEGNVRFFPSEDDYEVDDQSPHDHSSSSFDMSATSGLSNECSNPSPIPRCYRPGPANVLQALTLSCSNDFINLERMETIGDSFLKFAVTVHLFLTHPNAHEGKLSHLRSRLVCNSNLYRLGRSKNLHDRIIATKFVPYENWVPPGYIVRHDKRLGAEAKPSSSNVDAKQQAVDLNIWSTDTLMDDEVLLGTKVWDDDKVTPIDNLSVSVWDPTSPEVIQTQQRLDHCLVTIQQAIPDKSVADCVEALVGCYLTARGERSALRLLRWFGVDCLPTSDSYVRPHGAPWSPPPPTISPDDPRWARLNEARYVWRLNELESRLHYTFKDPALLLQAFTHPSYHQLRKTPSPETDPDPFVTTFLTDNECYQRLEFLGDAVLDYVITRFLYEDSQQHSPGVLTDLRSALVNNNIFAALAVRIGLHEFLRASSPQLLHMIDAFVCYQKEVAKDDLDYITSEDIEIRELEPLDPLDEEPANTLTGVPTDSTAAGTCPVDQPNTRPKCARTTGDDDDEADEDEVEDDDRFGTADASLLVTAKDQESQWQKANAKHLLGHFMDGTSDVADKSTANDSSGLHSKSAQTLIEQSHASVGDSRPVSDDIEIPKALGDIFESLAGAIFLDSGLSLDTVWTVFYPIMKERIERYTACIPKSPVRHLLELEPEGTRFERPRRTADGRVSVCAHVLGKGRFYGIGRNYRLAKSLAAKRALRVLKKLQAEHSSNASKLS